MSFRGWRRRKHPYAISVVLVVVLGVGSGIAFIHGLNTRLNPILMDLALTQTSNRITAAVDQAVSAQSVSYSDLVTFERSTSGDIVAMTSNMARANALRAQLLDVALTALDGLETTKIGIPLGTIFDIDIFSGLGPDIDIRVLYTGTASAEFENQFFSAGINQTCHQIVFKVDAELVVLLPGRQYRSTVSTEVCVAETIIVGKVPETYLQLGM